MNITKDQLEYIIDYNTYFLHSHLSNFEKKYQLDKLKSAYYHISNQIEINKKTSHIKNFPDLSNEPIFNFAKWIEINPIPDNIKQELPYRKDKEYLLSLSWKFNNDSIIHVMHNPESHNSFVFILDADKKSFKLPTKTGVFYNWVQYDDNNSLANETDVYLTEYVLFENIQFIISYKKAVINNQLDKSLTNKDINFLIDKQIVSKRGEKYYAFE